MNDYKWVEGIPSSTLSNRALVLISQFSRVLKKKSGRHLNLQDPDLSANLVRELKISDSAELHSIFNDLLSEFHSAAELKQTSLPMAKMRPPKNARQSSQNSGSRLNK